MCSCAIGTSFFLFLLFYIFLFFSFHFIESYYCICFFLLGVVEAVLRSGMEMELITPIVVMEGEERGGVGPKKKIKGRIRNKNLAPSSSYVISFIQFPFPA